MRALIWHLAISLILTTQSVWAIEPADLNGSWKHEESGLVAEFRSSGQRVEGFLVEMPRRFHNLGFELNEKLLSEVRISETHLAFKITIRTGQAQYKDLCRATTANVVGQIHPATGDFHGTIRPGEFVLLHDDNNIAVRCLHFPNDTVEEFVLKRHNGPIEIQMADGRMFTTLNRVYQLDDIRPFRVKLSLAAPAGSPPTQITLRWQEGEAQIPLTATDRPEVFLSEWRYLGNHTMRDHRDLGSLLYPNEDSDYNNTKDNFAGNWAVNQTGGELGEATGLGVVAEDGRRVDLYLSGNDREKHYRSFEIQATHDPEGGRHTFGARMQEVSNHPPAELFNGRADWPQARVVFLPDATETLTFEHGSQRAGAKVTFYTTPSDRIRFLLVKRSAGRIAGHWSAEKSNGDLGNGGQASWTRDSRIERALAVDDQTQRYRPGRVIDRSYVYPFGGNTRETGATGRTILVYGKNLPSSYGDALIIRDDDPTIDYRLEGLPGEDRIMFERGWAKAGVENPEDYDALLVHATLKRGVTSGMKLFTVNGNPAMWHLFFADAVGRPSFSHQWRDTEFTASTSLYSADTAYVVIDDMSVIPNESIDFKVLKNGTEVGRVTARRVGSPANAEYQSQAIRLIKSSDTRYAPPIRSGSLDINVSGGDKLEAEAVDPSLLALVPATFSATIYDQPSELGAVWSNALGRMAACHGDMVTDFSRITHEKAEEYSKFILTELGTRTIRINKGDHAAAIIIRDEIVRMMREILPAYRAILTGGDRKILEFMAAGRSNPEPFWRAIEGQDGLGNEVKLGQILNYRSRAASWNMTPAAAERHVIAQVRAGLRAFIGKMRSSIRRANGAGDCDVMELMVIAGQKTDPAVARILPRLVQLETDGDLRYWAPDLVAQGYVSGLHITGAAIRALEAYARIDDAYKAMALALASGGAAFALSGIGYAGAGAYLMIAADVADMAYFGGKGIYEYLEGEKLVEYAKGVTPAIGEDFLANAELASTEWYWAAVGLIAPGFGAGVGLKSLRNLKNADAVARGAALADQVDVLDEVSLARLTDAQRTDLAARYTDLLARRIKGGANALSDVDKAHLQKFDAFFGNARPTASAATAAAKTADDFWPAPAAAGSAAKRLTQPARTVDSVLGGGTSPRAVGTAVETPGGMKPVFKQGSCNTCGVAAARTAVARAIGKELSEQEMIRNAVLSGRGYRTGLNFETGAMSGGTTARGMADMLEDAGVATRSLPRAAMTDLNPGRFLDDVTKEVKEGNQVLTLVDYSRRGGKGASPHWVNVERVANGRVTRNGRTVIDGPYVVIGDPATGKSVAIARSDFIRHWRPRESVVGLSAANAANLSSTARRGRSALSSGVRGGAAAAVKAADLPQSLPQLRGLVQRGGIAQADLADLIDDIDRILYTQWKYNADRVKFIARHALNEQIGRLPQAVKDELLPLLRLRSGSTIDFMGRPLRNVDPRMLGFGTTTGNMRNAANASPLLAQFRQHFRGSSYLDLAGRMEPDHIVPVKNILAMDHFNELSAANQARILHDMRNIQSLPSRLNISKSNLTAAEWQARLARRGDPPLPADYYEWLVDAQRKLKADLQDEITRLYNAQ